MTILLHVFVGLAAFPSEDRLSPLDTFLDLLTAKGTLIAYLFLFSLNIRVPMATVHLYSHYSNILYLF